MRKRLLRAHVSTSCCERVGGVEEGPDAPKAASDMFESTEDRKDVQIDDTDPSKHVRIGATLSDRQEGALINFLQTNRDACAWKPAYMLGIPREFA